MTRGNRTISRRRCRRRGVRVTTRSLILLNLPVRSHKEELIRGRRGRLFFPFCIAGRTRHGAFKALHGFRIIVKGCCGLCHDCRVLLFSCCQRCQGQMSGLEKECQPRKKKKELAKSGANRTGAQPTASVATSVALVTLLTNNSVSVS